VSGAQHSHSPEEREQLRAEALALREYNAKQRRLADQARKGTKRRARKRARDYRRRVSP
jgi:hypothetical protein